MDMGMDMCMVGLKDMGMVGLKDMGMVGLASAWAVARRRTKDYRHKVDAATRPQT